MTAGANAIAMAENTLLLVDDEENILRALTRLLRRDGYRILTAGSAAAGLHILGDNPDVGVVISDQRMPGMSGAEFLGMVKTRFPGTARFILSGYAEPEALTQAMAEGAVSRLFAKPWDDDVLRANVRQAFAQHAIPRGHAANTCDGETPAQKERGFARRTGERRIPDADRTTTEHDVERLPSGDGGVDHDGG